MVDELHCTCMCCNLLFYTVCKRRYKTVASLKAHTTQYHGRDISASSSPVPQPTLPAPTPAPVPVPVPAPVPSVPEEKVPVFLRPPPSLQVRGGHTYLHCVHYMLWLGYSIFACTVIPFS